LVLPLLTSLAFWYYINLPAKSNVPLCRDEMAMTADNSPSWSLAITDGSSLPALGTEIESAAEYARAEKAAATRRAYRSDFALFRSWCEAKRVPALPAAPKAVAAFLAAEANRGAK
jgi:hypothetical protein